MIEYGYGYGEDATSPQRAKRGADAIDDYGRLRQGYVKKKAGENAERHRMHFPVADKAEVMVKRDG